MGVLGEYIQLFLKSFFKLIAPVTIIDYTLKCLNIGTPKIINFPFVPNGKLMIFMYPNI